MFLECELPYQAHYSCGLTTDFIEKPFPHFLASAWQKTGTGMQRVRVLENFSGIPRINCIVSFNLICAMVLRQKVMVFGLIFSLVHCSTYLSFVLSFPLPSFLIFSFCIELYVSLNILIFHTRRGPFERINVFVFFPLTLGQVSCSATQLLSIINVIFLSLPQMAILYLSLHITFI